MGRATEWIDQQIGDRLTVGDVAALVGVSAVRLQTLFRREVGCSVGEYRTRLRVGRHYVGGPPQVYRRTARGGNAAPASASANT